jgi:hypothetical protein
VVFNEIYNTESKSLLLLDDCLGSNECHEALQTDDVKTFLDICLIQPGANNKPAKNKSKIKAFGIDYKSPPFPRICHSIVMLFLQVTFGSSTGLDTMKTVMELQGKHSSATPTRPEFEYPKTEPDYVVRVSLTSCNLAACRQITLYRSGLVPCNLAACRHITLY